ncbi:helix-turn-helix transcriptional regulator [uncultured Maricaulis sp.]|uniref:helix-turn-helix transcriptional regulator n=1 Tax=uncultured Maricaulis sp. TaxID=174710 RepID=UPI0026055B85|nr:helix-turn-helix transcriptional regulator [uncultured Maricaulis sp.]
MLSRALKQLRVFHGLKQVELASRLGVSASHVSEIEKGTKTPSLDLIDQYAREFRVPASSILYFSEQLSQPHNGRGAVAEKVLKILEFISFDEKSQNA